MTGRHSRFDRATVARCDAPLAFSKLRITRIGESYCVFDVARTAFVMVVQIYLGAHPWLFCRVVGKTRDLVPFDRDIIKDYAIDPAYP